MNGEATTGPALRCEGSWHDEGFNGHGGDAAYRVRISCEQCDYEVTRHLCAGRVWFAVGSDQTMSCPVCGHRTRVGGFWQDIEPVPGEALRVAFEEEMARLLDWYRTYMRAAGRSGGTIKLRLRHMHNLMSAHPNLMSVSRRDLQEYLAARRESHASNTRRTMLASFRTFYGWLSDEELLDTDPAARLTNIPQRVTRSRIVDDSDVKDALKDANPHDRAILLLARTAGLRRAEIASLRTTDRQGSRLYVRGKGDRVRRIQLAPVVVTVLEQLEAGYDHLPGYYFEGRGGGHIHPDTVYNTVRRLCGWHPHALRHGAATSAYRATHDLRAVQEMLGHASPTTTAIYVHLDEDAERAVSRAAADGF